MATLLTLEVQLIELPGGSTLKTDSHGDISIGTNYVAIVQVGGIVVRGNKGNDPGQAVRNLFTLLTAGPGTGDRGADAELAIDLWVSGTDIKSELVGKFPELATASPESSDTPSP